MKNSLIGSVIVLSATSLTASAEEFSWGNVTFQPRAYAGYANYKLESGSFNAIYFRPDGSILQEGKAPLNLDLFDHDKLKITGPLWGIGGTIASGQFFGDFYYQSTPNDSAYSGTVAEGVRGGVPYSLYRNDVDAQHADWALSIGYMITGQWSVFAGYKSGNTEWDQPFRFNVRSSEDTSLITDGNLDAKFEQDGPFLGASYSFLIGPGALTFKAAYAYLDGTYKWNYGQAVYPPFSGEANPVSIVQRVKLDGNSNAFSLGVSWTQSLADNLGISLGANYHRYEFEMSGVSNVDSQNTSYQDAQISDGDLTEDLFTLTASLIYTF